MRITDILCYWEGTRGAGHTELSLRGVTETTKFFYVVANNSQGIDARKKYRNAKILTIHDECNRLYGCDLPLIVDHFAMAILIREEQQRLLELGRELKRPTNSNDSKADKA